MLYANVANTVFRVTLQAGIQEVPSETLALHALRKVVVLVKLQTRPIKANPYELRQPMTVMRATAGTTADGALANAAMPAGSVNTPAPTIDLTKLNTSCEMVAVPSPTAAPSADDPSSKAPSLVAQSWGKCQ